MPGIPWWGWAAAAAVMALAELHAPGSYLIWIAVGAAITAGVAATSAALSLEPQIAAFAAAAGFSCVLGWFVYRTMPGRRGEDTLLNRRALQLVGARAIVCDAFVNGEGKVRVGDSLWLAEGPTLHEGDAVIVTAVRGARLVVRDASRSA
jgi:membrane protein implicated in regulation of membrane protease activity